MPKYEELAKLVLKEIRESKYLLGITATQIARKLNIPREKVSRCLFSLKVAGLVTNVNRIYWKTKSG